jgi:hypothetical protein
VAGIKASQDVGIVNGIPFIFMFDLHILTVAPTQHFRLLMRSMVYAMVCYYGMGGMGRLFQCVLWVAYAFFIRELAIVPVNAVGSLFAFYYTVSYATIPTYHIHHSNSLLEN